MVGLMGLYINWFVGFCFINLIEMGKDQTWQWKMEDVNEPKWKFVSF